MANLIARKAYFKFGVVRFLVAATAVCGIFSRQARHQIGIGLQAADSGGKKQPKLNEICLAPPTLSGYDMMGAPIVRWAAVIEHILEATRCVFDLLTEVSGDSHKALSVKKVMPLYVFWVVNQQNQVITPSEFSNPNPRSSTWARRFSTTSHSKSGSEDFSCPLLSFWKRQIRFSVKRS